jgi:hypothetical protein
VRSRTRIAFAVGGSVVLAGLAEVATYQLWRDWCVHWGSTDREANVTLPGDDCLADPEFVTTRAIGVDGPPSSIWPWLAQMGSGRGGLYTYDWIENLFGLDMHSVDVVLPDFQQVGVGDTQTIGKSGPTFRVVVCQPDRALVLRSEDGNWVWAFLLRPHGDGTRLISRNRFRLPGAPVGLRLFYRYVMEPGSLVMERKMLLGIKERAERLAREGAVPEP